jgi:hypothetical protein
MSHVAQMQSTTAEAADRPGFDRLWHPRGQLCAVCTSRTRGFGWFDPNTSRGKRTYRWFCTMHCQSVFTRKAKKGLTVVDFTEEETMSLPAVMRALAPVMEDIGWDRQLCQLSQHDIRHLIVVAIETFRREMIAIDAQFGEGVPF